MRIFNLTKGLVAAAVVLGSTACSSSPPVTISSSYVITKTHQFNVAMSFTTIVIMVVKQTMSPSNFDAGEHTIIARYAFIKKYVPGGPLENYFKLNGTFEPGKIYEFKYNRDQENGTAEVWIVDAETQKAVTNKVTKKLSRKKLSIRHRVKRHGVRQVLCKPFPRLASVMSTSHASVG